MTRDQAMQMRKLLEKQTESMTDDEIINYPAFVEKWKSDMSYDVGKRLEYGGAVYKVLQAHTSQDTWLPGTGTESLYTRIDEQHDGTKYDPIPYSGNMTLEAGKYYSQSGKTYLCNRDTGNPVYNALADLVGIYVTEVTI